MTQKSISNLPASIRDRLKNKAKETGRPLSEIMLNYATERFLYRLGKSRQMERFVLKGAMMLRVWEIPSARQTTDIDFLGHPTMRNEGRLDSVIRGLLESKSQDDGLEFDVGTLLFKPIIPVTEYQGTRVTFIARLGTARINMQLDISFDDPIPMEPVKVTYPVILDHAPPKLMGYRPEMSIAEKFQAMVYLGLTNSRLKDFYDIATLSELRQFDSQDLGRALSTIFQRRNTPLPLTTPIALTPAFFNSAGRASQWSSFWRTSRLQGTEPDLAVVAARIESFMMPVSIALVKGKPFKKTWLAAKGWR